MLETIITQNCTPNVHPAIVNAIVATESNFKPFAIGVNRGTRLARQPSDYASAVATAKHLIATGANIDLGLGQINSANLQWLGLSVEQVLEPCTNLKALQHVYLYCHDKAGNNGLGTRMQRAFSCYNTGGMTKGFKNGYVTKTTNTFNRLIANFTNPSAPPQNTQIAHTLKNGSTIAVEPHKTVLATQVPPNAQNAAISDYERSDDDNLDPLLTLENIPAENAPIRVYNSWDIFRDF